MTEGLLIYRFTYNTDFQNYPTAAVIIIITLSWDSFCIIVTGKNWRGHVDNQILGEEWRDPSKNHDISLSENSIRF